ncbi:gephyrin-like molybdotransferase Glp [Arthrobacter sp. TMP15]|uniref:molybdopterin molybdotransferase MoeA n=1 Tax=Arthrobacter sp. TMP15 TaxID=3140789 RepID=UPI0031BA765C
MRRAVLEHLEAVEQLLRRSWAGGIVAEAGVAAGVTLTMGDGGTPVPLQSALGRVLANDLVAPLDLPPFANSQMDGYAIYLEAEQPENIDSDKSTVYGVAETIAAGAVPQRLAAGQAAPIMTGAMMPLGANAVVPIELALPAHFGAPGENVELPATTVGKFVRAQGSDVQRGSVVIAGGTLLNAAHVGLAAALGCTELAVRAKPRVLLLTTGDEVLAPGDSMAGAGLPPGMIFDANESLLRASLTQAGVEVVRSHVVRDDPEALLRLLDSYVGEDQLLNGASGPCCDLIISVGGISAGAFEVIRQALGEPSSEAAVDFVSVALQPGGPQALGTYRGIPFIGFPGNPVSAFVSFEMFLRPALGLLLGAPAPRQRVVATLEHPIISPVGKQQVRRGIYSGPEFESAPSVREIGGESSHLLGALAQANALISIPAGVTELQAGAKVEVWLL